MVKQPIIWVIAEWDYDDSFIIEAGMSKALMQERFDKYYDTESYNDLTLLGIPIVSNAEEDLN